MRRENKPCIDDFSSDLYNRVLIEIAKKIYDFFFVDKLIPKQNKNNTKKSTRNI